MEFCWVTLHVKDMEESLRFYEEVVGLEIDNKFNAGPGVEIVFLGDGQTKIELICDRNGNDVSMGNDISLGFEVESMEKMIEFIEFKGLEVHSGPFSPNPSVKFFFVEDPNGLKIQFVENVK